jgi:hypothetical protein
VLLAVFSLAVSVRTQVSTTVLSRAIKMTPSKPAMSRTLESCDVWPAVTAFITRVILQSLRMLVSMVGIPGDE